jgi:Zn-dependent protease with chaperone function
MIFVVAGLPLFLILLSLWQLQRLPKVEEISSINGERQHIGLRTNISPAYTASTRTYFASQKYNDTDHFTVFLYGTLLPVFVGCVFFLSVIALTIFLVFIFSIRRMGMQALRSRGKLLRIFRSAQKITPWLLVLVSILLFSALALALSFEILNFASGVSVFGGTKQIIVVFGAVVVASVLYLGTKTVWNLIKASRSVFEREPVFIMGKRVSWAEAPLVWEFICSLADKAEANVPDNIVVGLNECFFVTENKVYLESGEEVPTGSTLYLPLSYMAFMSRSETAAVIGHELSHFSGEDTEYGRHFSPIYHAITNLTALRSPARYDQWLVHPVMMLGEFFLSSFDQAVQYWSRKRELAADRMGARLAGRKAAAAALLRVAVLEAPVNRAITNCWNGGGGFGVLAELRRLIQQDGLDDPRMHLEDRQIHPTDSHPTTRQRLEALGVDVDDALLDHTRDLRGSNLLGELGLEDEHPAEKEESSAWFLKDVLEAEFLDVANLERKKNIDTLIEKASLGRGRVDIYEGKLQGIAFLLLSVVLFLVSTLSFRFMAGIEKTIFSASSLSIGLFLSYLSLDSFQRKRLPAMTLTRRGLRLSNMRGVLPWIKIRNYDIKIKNIHNFSIISLVVDVDDKYDSLIFFGRGRAKYKRKEQKLFVNVIVEREFSESLDNVFLTYWQAAHAREELEKYNDLFALPLFSMQRYGFLSENMQDPI